MKTWMKFALVGLANVLVVTLISILGFGITFHIFYSYPSLATVLSVIYFVVFVAIEGFILYRFTRKSGKCRYLWVTILVYVVASIAVLTFVFYRYHHWVGMLMAMVARFTLIITAVTCLTVWIIQIVNRKKLKGMI